MRRGGRKRTNRIRKEKQGVLGLLSRPPVLKTARFAVIALLTALTAVYLYDGTADVMRIERVEVIGNRHLSDKEVVALLGLGPRVSMLRTGSRELAERVLSSPWVREVVVRKEPPRLLIVKIKEAEPLALLKRKGRLYIVSREGEVLEELNQTIAFLPVITMKERDRALLGEALRLAAVVREDDLFSGEEIEILARSAEEMSMKVGRLLIKVGSGDYRNKLSRLIQLKDEIVRRGIPVEFVDLRFSRRVIVREARSRG